MTRPSADDLEIAILDEALAVARMRRQNIVQDYRRAEGVLEDPPPFRNREHKQRDRYLAIFLMVVGVLGWAALLLAWLL